jgi:phosphotransferase system enzyme I (PtsI)
MDVYKGTGAFSGIAIGKILYYHKSEYQMRQYEITDVKTELNIFRQARTRVMEQLEDLYEKNILWRSNCFDWCNLFHSPYGNGNNQ